MGKIFYPPYCSIILVPSIHCKQMVADPYRKMVHVFFYVNFSNAKARTENFEILCPYFLFIKPEFDHYCVMVGGLNAVDLFLHDLVLDHAHMVGRYKAKVY